MNGIDSNYFFFVVVGLTILTKTVDSIETSFQFFSDFNRRKLINILNFSLYRPLARFIKLTTMNIKSDMREPMKSCNSFFLQKSRHATTI